MPHSFGQVFSIFEELEISVDVVATSEVSISLTLDPSKLWSRELIQQASSCRVFNTLFSNSYMCVCFKAIFFIFPLLQELDHVVEELEKIAVVNLAKGRAIISLIGNVQHSSLILERVKIFTSLKDLSQKLKYFFCASYLDFFFFLTWGRRFMFFGSKVSMSR